MVCSSCCCGWNVICCLLLAMVLSNAIWHLQRLCVIYPGVAAAEDAADMTDSPKVAESVVGTTGTDAAAPER